MIILGHNVLPRNIMQTNLGLSWGVLCKNHDCLNIGLFIWTLVLVDLTMASNSYGHRYLCKNFPLTCYKMSILMTKPTNPTQMLMKCIILAFLGFDVMQEKTLMPLPDNRNQHHRRAWLTVLNQNNRYRGKIRLLATGKRFLKTGFGSVLQKLSLSF